MGKKHKKQKPGTNLDPAPSVSSATTKRESTSDPAIISQGEAWAAIVIYLTVCLIGLWRNFFGVSVADEPLYTVLADFNRLGGTWFVTDKTVQTTAAILISPFVSLYSALFGSSAIMLFTRSIYLCSAILSSLVVFRFLRMYLRWPVALVFASIYVAFIPHNMISLTYNSMACQYFAVGLMSSLIALTERNKNWAILSGFVWVLCGFAYATGPFIFAITGALLYWRFHRQENFKSEFLVPFLKGSVPLALILIGVLLYLGVDNIRATIEYGHNFALPGTMFNPQFQLHLLKLLGSYLPPWWMILGGLGLWIYLLKEKSPHAYLGFFSLVLSFMFFGGKSEQLYVPIIWPLIQILVFIPVFFEGALNQPQSKTLILNIILPALVGSFITCMTSRMTVYNMYITGITGSMALSLLVVKRHRFAGWFLALLLLGFVLRYQLTSTYEDDPPSQLSHQIMEGPYKYLHTSKAKGEFIESIQNDLKNLPSSASIMFKDHFPVGFLMSKMQMLGPTTNILPAFLHPEARPIYFKIFQDRKYFADYIVEIRVYPATATGPYYYMSPDDNNPHEFFKRDVFYNFFMKSGEYEVLWDRGAYRVLKRIKSS